MTTEEYHVVATELSSTLGLKNAPLAISFSQEAPDGVDDYYDAPMPEPTVDGRTGRVPAGCVFWIKAQDRSFTTVAEDHGNCSVGCVTHGLKTLEEVANNSDVACLVDAGWVSPEVFPQIPTVKGSPKYVTYGPLGETILEPDIVLLRLNGKQAMIMSDAIPEIAFQGKPQCHIIAMAKEQNQDCRSTPPSSRTCARPPRACWPR